MAGTLEPNSVCETPFNHDLCVYDVFSTIIANGACHVCVDTINVMFDLTTIFYDNLSFDDDMLIKHTFPSATKATIMGLPGDIHIVCLQTK